MKDVQQENLFGFDVDPKVIAMCRETVPYGNYSVVQPSPPTNAADNSFDVIYAYSVFSHLSEEVQSHWVEELGCIETGRRAPGHHAGSHLLRLL